MLTESPEYRELTKHEQDSIVTVLFYTTVYSACATDETGQRPADRLPPIVAPRFVLSHLVSEQFIDQGLELLEDIGVIESTRTHDDQPAVRITDAAISSGWMQYRPQTRRYIDKLKEFAAEPSIERHLGRYSVAEHYVYDSLTAASWDFHSIDPETDLSGESTIDLLRTMLALIALTTRNVWIVKDRVSGMLSTPITIIPPQWRHKLLYGGENPQAVVVPDIDLQMIAALALKHRAEQYDIYTFMQDVRDGKFYPLVASELNVSTEQARSLVRQFIYSEIDRSDSEIGPVEQLVSDRYPAIVATINYYKLGFDGVRELASEIDKLKRSLIVDTASQAVYAEFVSPDEFCSIVDNGLLVDLYSAPAASRSLFAALRQLGVWATVELQKWAD